MDVDQLLALSVKARASDLHLLPGMAPIIRVDGLLAPIKEQPVLTADDTKRLIDAILTLDQQKQFEQDRVIELAYNTALGNFRGSVFHQMHGVAAAFRVIPQVVPTIEELELPPVLKKLLVKSRGLILAAGPTGSGKSTTLAAMIDYINTYRVCNVVTIEDPIEFIHTNKRSIFNQIQVGRDAIDFATALRSSLRQDPNVILLGELRDLETMRLALSAVETGHLVLATIHAGSAPLAISRFADVFSAEERNRVRTLLSETLEAVVCQRLIRKKEGGRVAIFEVMLSTASVRNYIKQDLPSHLESAMQTGGDVGMITFDRCLNELVKKHVITDLIANSVNQELKSFLDFGKKKE